MRMTTIIAITTYRRILAEYREEELQYRFGPKYVEKWRRHL